MSSSSSSSDVSPSPGRTYQKPTGDLERALEDLEISPFEISEDSEIDLLRPPNDSELEFLSFSRL
jgi:hypothetical protein